MLTKCGSQQAGIYPPLGVVGQCPFRRGVWSDDYFYTIVSRRPVGGLPGLDWGRERFCDSNGNIPPHHAIEWRSEFIANKTLDAQPAIALQYILSGDEIAIGTAVILFFQYFGSAVFLAISKSIFLNVLDTSLHKYAPSVPFEDIVNAGATDLVNVVPAQYYKGVITAYSNALVATFVSFGPSLYKAQVQKLTTMLQWLAAAASIIAFFFSFGLGWTRVTEQIAKMYTKDVEPRAGTRPTAPTMEPQARSLKA
jgi:hypothetical protein